MLLAVRISSYGCTWEVWRALKKLELLSAAPRATLTLLSCSSNFPRASITRYTHAKHEPILNYNIARALVLSNSFSAIMNKIFMYAQPCSTKWRVQFWKRSKISVELCGSSFCVSFDNVKIILNNPIPNSSLWLPAWQICLLQREYFDFVCLHFHWIFLLCLPTFHYN